MLLLSLLETAHQDKQTSGATVWMAFHPEPGLGWWPKNIKLIAIFRGLPMAWISSVFWKHGLRKGVIPWRRQVIKYHTHPACMKAPRLPALLQCHVCCRNGQPICTQCKRKPLFALQQSTSALAKMRLLMLHVMTYLMFHFPEEMRTCNYPYAQCELRLLSNQKVQLGIQMSYFKWV